MPEPQSRRSRSVKAMAVGKNPREVACKGEARKPCGAAACSVRIGQGEVAGMVKRQAGCVAAVAGEASRTAATHASTTRNTVEGMPRP